MDKLILYFFGIFLLIPSLTQAQNVSDFEDVEGVGKKGFFKTYIKGFFSDFKTKGEPFQMSGGWGTNLRSYNAWGIPNRQDPFFYSFNANLNIQVYQLNLPFTLLLTARNQDSSLPNPREFINAFKDQIGSYQNRFVRVGASPYYKWMKVHLGHRGMNFSPLTMSNLNFLGVGTELTPGKVRLAGMYGRLANAQPRNLAVNGPNVQTFERVGYGMKLGYGTNADFVDFIFFKAHDDPNSITLDPESTQELAAADNLVLGLVVKKTLMKKLSLNLEYAGSAYTPDLGETIEGDNPFPYPTSLFERRTSSQFKNALDIKMQYQAKIATLGVQFKRIEPEYRSLGTYFFNDDLQNMTLNAGFGMFEGKMQVNSSFGTQKNNLDNTEPTQVRRIIGSLNLTYALEKLNLGLNYSNYTSDVAYLLNQTADSLNAIIVTQDAGVTATYNWQAESGNTHVISSNFNVQMVSDDVADPQTSSQSQMLVGNVNYNIIMKETGWRITTRINFNQNELATIKMNRWGGGVGIGKSFFENKLTTNLDINYFFVDQSTGNNNSTLNNRFRASYRWKKKHNFNFSAGYINQQKNGSTDNSAFSELTTTFGYSYRFSYNPKKKKAAKDKKNKQGTKVMSKK